MDLDIEMGDAAEVLQDSHEQHLPHDEDILQPDEPEEPGEVAEDDQKNDDDDVSKTIIPTKVHIRGVDTLHTDDIKAYVQVHFGGVDKVEWIDDTSANLVFGSEPIARDAIVALSSIEIADASALGVGETVPAKPFQGKPEISLHVRFAVESDRKQAGAALRSRYYLLHPEHDPEEKRRRHQENRSRYRDRDRDRDYRRSGGRRRHESEDEVETFEASMYDDAPRPSKEKERPSSDPEGRPKPYTRENRGKELFGDRSAGRDRLARDRSASPRRDRNVDVDGDAEMDDPPSSSRNRTKARSIKDRLSVDNKSKELFPSKPLGGRGGQLDQLEKAIGSARLREEDMPKIVAMPDVSTTGDGLNIRGIASQRSNGDGGFSIKGAAANARELFPDKLGASNTGKELLDMSRAARRRQRAEDLFS